MYQKLVLDMVRLTGLEPVPIAGHAPQTCAYADSATTANKCIITGKGNFVNRQRGCFLVRTGRAGGAGTVRGQWRDGGGAAGRGML